MAPEVDDLETLNILKDQATARARDLGHCLQPFRAANRDPLCCVSFCSDCRQMVIVNVGAGGRHPGGAFGYALEVPCAARRAATGPQRVTAADGPR